MKEVHTYCRNCQGTCGMTLKVEDNRIVSATSDRLNPYSEGYFCIKGTLGAEFASGAENRLVECLKRGADGALHPIDKYQAVDEIAEKLRDISKLIGKSVNMMKVTITNGSRRYRSA